jgi:flagellar biosynthesis/type III secretory pathway protein FliH
LGKDDDGALMPADGAEDARRQTASPDSPPSPISDAAPNVAPYMTQDIGSGNQASEASGNSANDAPANDALANDAVEHDSTADNGDGDATEGTPLAANFETVTAAFERGKAEGMIAGRDAGIAETKTAAEATAQENLTDKIAAFEAALVALAKPQALQAEDLSRSIHAAILKLASQRAGQQIDDMPENFLVRIEALVTSIGQKMAAGKVHINADDYKVMLPYLADTQFDFVAEPGLARGDVILKFAGVELHDIAEARLGGQYAETAKTLAKAPADLAPGITPDEITPTEPASTEPAPVETAPVETAPVETAPVETASGEGVAASDSAASKNDQDEQPPSPPDETSS